MNDQDKAAFAVAAKEWATKSAGKDLGEYFFQAALDYMRSTQEPIGYMRKNDLEKLLSRDAGNHLNIGLDTRQAWPIGEDESKPYDHLVAIYITPPAAEVDAQLLETLKSCEWHSLDLSKFVRVKVESSIAAAEALQSRIRSTKSFTSASNGVVKEVSPDNRFLLLESKKELDLKIENLASLVNRDSTFFTLSVLKQELFRTQLNLMYKLSDVLAQRVALLPEVE